MAALVPMALVTTALAIVGLATVGLTTSRGKLFIGAFTRCALGCCDLGRATDLVNLGLTEGAAATWMPISRRPLAAPLAPYCA